MSDTTLWVETTLHISFFDSNTYFPSLADYQSNAIKLRDALEVGALTTYLNQNGAIQEDSSPLFKNIVNKIENLLSCFQNTSGTTCEAKDWDVNQINQRMFGRSMTLVLKPYETQPLTEVETENLIDQLNDLIGKVSEFYNNLTGIHIDIALQIRKNDIHSNPVSTPSPRARYS